MTHSGWPGRLARGIAAQVRRNRDAQGLSAQRLADRCSGLGLDIGRSTIADLENGRRESVSVAELLVLAAALSVPPVELAIPLGRQDSTEILPGVEVPTWDAGRWFRGDIAATQRGRGMEFQADDGSRDDLAVFWLTVHDDMVRACQIRVSMLDRLRRRVADGPHAPDDAWPDWVADLWRSSQETFEMNLSHDEEELGRHRAIMRYLGWRVPPLPPDLPGPAAEEERYLALLRDSIRHPDVPDDRVRRHAPTLLGHRRWSV